MSNFSHRQQGASFNQAPDQTGRTDVGMENLQVKCILWPEKDVMDKVLTKASVAVRGNIFEDDEVDEVAVADMYRGGLNQALEWFTVAFECSGVTRGLTHQLVRTRKASFSQQSMRYADMGNFNVRMPEEIAKRTEPTWLVPSSQMIHNYPTLAGIVGTITSPKEVWEKAIQVSREAYAWLAEQGIPMQDVRTVTPTAVETYIICEYPLSEFIATYSYRACQMFYPEMVAIMGLMKAALLEKCPWLENMIKISCERTVGNMSKGGELLPHKCTYQGYERVEGQCTFPWALEENRTYKSKKVQG